MSETVLQLLYTIIGMCDDFNIFSSVYVQWLIISLTNPGEVNTNLFSKIFPHMIQWLTFVEVSPLGPVVV